jgi:hypothetical protein
MRLVFFSCCVALLTSCASTKSTAQSDQNSIIRESSEPEIHGEVGAIYGRSL